MMNKLYHAFSEIFTAKFGVVFLFACLLMM